MLQRVAPPQRAAGGVVASAPAPVVAAPPPPSADTIELAQRISRVEIHLATAVSITGAATTTALNAAFGNKNAPKLPGTFGAVLVSPQWSWFRL